MLPLNHQLTFKYLLLILGPGYTMMNVEKESPVTMRSKIFVVKNNQTNGKSLSDQTQIYP